MLTTCWILPGVSQTVAQRRPICAVLHAICQSNADTLAGEDPQSRDQVVWRQAYRALNHGYARRRCLSALSDGRFSPAVCELAERFVFSQNRRHRADYDPDESFTPQEAWAAVTQIDDIINDFRRVSARKRRAFAGYILMRDARAEWQLARRLPVRIDIDLWQI